MAVDLLEHVPDGAEFGKTIGGRPAVFNIS